MRGAVLLVLLLGAGGCCPKPAPEVRYVPQRVEVPVAAPPREPPVFERLPLPVDSIPDDAPPAEVIRRLVAAILQLQGEVKQRDEALQAYRRAPAPNRQPTRRREREGTAVEDAGRQVDTTRPFAVSATR